ncbi:MAG TPA: D-amino acid dehydrogenase [Gammaproteobacteria bacterium]|nr:D-amino acid dehydrogenase [Gammaproteobacteria bacterium]
MHVIIIGAGLLGTTTAYFLAESGHQVTVLDRAEAVASETSFANGGILHASYAAPWNGPGLPGQVLRWLGRRDAPLVVHPSALPAATRWAWGFFRHSRPELFEASLRSNARLALYSLRQLRDLRARLGLRYDEAARGALMVFRDAQALEDARRQAALLERAGVRAEPLDSAELHRRVPALEDARVRLAGGMYYPDDECGDARLFARRLAGRARELGADFRLGTTVRRVLRERGRVSGVDTTGGELRADAVVLAAGSYSAGLARPLGLALPICPVKGYSATLTLSEPAQAPALPILDTGRRLVFAPLGARLRIAGFAELAGFDTRAHPRRIRALLRGAAELFPGLVRGVDPAGAEPWAGLRPMTHDGRPLLGQSPVPGLYLATGTGHLGWTFSAGAGKIVAAVVSGAEPEIEVGDFGYRRAAERRGASVRF